MATYTNHQCIALSITNILFLAVTGVSKSVQRSINNCCAFWVGTLICSLQGITVTQQFISIFTLGLLPTVTSLIKHRNTGTLDCSLDKAVIFYNRVPNLLIPTDFPTQGLLTSSFTLYNVIQGLWSCFFFGTTVLLKED
uniref:Uncharacterized protein n=1 Tax=Rhizophagus irregularis (strain DAOM 181602 / DAOM 197198 / MUCL 43194) TaxID=747089 RepID=U9TA52_RHIID